jgi:hypothetical protein
MAIFAETRNLSMHDCQINEVHGNQFNITQNSFISCGNETGLDSFSALLYNTTLRSLRLYFAGGARSERDTIAEWLSPLEFESHQAKTFGKRSEGSGEWLLDSTTFKEWRDGTSGTLFCPGIRMFSLYCPSGITGANQFAEQLVLARL